MPAVLVEIAAALLEVVLALEMRGLVGDHRGRGRIREITADCEVDPVAITLNAAPSGMGVAVNRAAACAGVRPVLWWMIASTPFAVMARL